MKLRKCSHRGISTLPILGMYEDTDGSLPFSMYDKVRSMEGKT
jgi:hypothetical protein